MKENFPSQKAKTHFLLQAAHVLLSGNVSVEELDAIKGEITDARGCTGNPDAIAKDLDSGLVSVETASKLRGYAEGEAEQAQKDKAERMAMAQTAQRGDEDFLGAKDRGDSNDADADL